MKTIITKVENNRVVKFLSVDDELVDEKLAELLPIYPEAFIYDGEYLPTLWVENGLISVAPIVESNENKIARLQAELDAIERAEIMPRGAREAFIVLCEQQAAAAGLTTEQAYQVNPFYKGLKDTDAQCVALRAQIRDLT